MLIKYCIEVLGGLLWKAESHSQKVRPTTTLFLRDEPKSIPTTVSPETSDVQKPMVNGYRRRKVGDGAECCSTTLWWQEPHFCLQLVGVGVGADFTRFSYDGKDQDFGPNFRLTCGQVSTAISESLVQEDQSNQVTSHFRQTTTSSVMCIIILAELHFKSQGLYAQWLWTFQRPRGLRYHVSQEP